MSCHRFANRLQGVGRGIRRHVFGVAFKACLTNMVIDNIAPMPYIDTLSAAARAASEITSMAPATDACSLATGGPRPPAASYPKGKVMGHLLEFLNDEAR